MSRVLIVARTRMRNDHVCIGGHDLSRRFRGVRLLDLFGAHFTTSCEFQIGEIWEVDYLASESVRRPHVEDVYVRSCSRTDSVSDLNEYLSRRVRPWRGSPDALFDRTLRASLHGAGYVPAHGTKPACSTGYWRPDASLVRIATDVGTRLRYPGRAGVTRLTWVGVQQCPDEIPADTLVRVSLSRVFSRPGVPEGHYLQISGAFGL